MHPYRTSADRPECDEPGREIRYDDRVLGMLMLVIGGLRVGLAIGSDEAWRAEVSIASIVAVLGVLLVLVRR